MSLSLNGNISIGTFGPESLESFELNQPRSAFEDAFLGFPDDPKPTASIINVFTRATQVINIPGFGDVRVFLQGLQEPAKGEVTTTNPFRPDLAIIVPEARLADLDALRTGQAGTATGGILGFIEQVAETPDILNELPISRQIEEGGLLRVLESAVVGEEAAKAAPTRSALITIGLGLLLVLGVGAVAFGATR